MRNLNRPAGWLLLISLFASTAAQADFRSEFYRSSKMYYVRVRDWNPDWMTPWSLDTAKSHFGATMEVFRTDPGSQEHCPDSIANDGDRVYRTQEFELRTSGNYTKNTPKSSFKVKMTNKKDRLDGMSALNLKAMWNDVSMMREAIAWKVFRLAGVPAPRHTYAKFCINGKYFGLYSMIEEVDESFLANRFGAQSKGNLYKAYWSNPALDLGPATLEYRKDASGDDSGRQYWRAADDDQRTYRLKTNDGKKAPAPYKTYDDLAALTRELDHGRAEDVFDVKGFLNWSAVSVLLGAWDNYWRTPANYYVYNGGAAGPGEFMERPYFRWIPWDYDSSLGSAFDDTKWHHADLVDWQGFSSGAKLPLPMIRKLLSHEPNLKYYLDRVEDALDATMNPDWVDGEMTRLWNHIQTAAYLESDAPTAAPHTGRQFTNDQVYWNGRESHELRNGDLRLTGIRHFVVMRHESARAQLKEWRKKYPRGSGALP